MVNVAAEPLRAIRGKKRGAEQAALSRVRGRPVTICSWACSCGNLPLFRGKRATQGRAI